MRYWPRLNNAHRNFAGALSLPHAQPTISSARVYTRKPANSNYNKPGPDIQVRTRGIPTSLPNDEVPANAADDQNVEVVVAAAGPRNGASGPKARPRKARALTGYLSSGHEQNSNGFVEHARASYGALIISTGVPPPPKKHA